MGFKTRLEYVLDQICAETRHGGSHEMRRFVADRLMAAAESGERSLDRLTEVVPFLEAEIEVQSEQFDNLSRYVPNARRFHEAIVSRCGNEPMILLIGSLELIWSAHESSVWSDEGDPMQLKTMRAALRDHHRLLDAIRDGESARAVRLAQDHLAAARRNTLAVGNDKTIEAKLISSNNHQESVR